MHVHDPPSLLFQTPCYAPCQRQGRVGDAGRVGGEEPSQRKQYGGRGGQNVYPQSVNLSSLAREGLESLGVLPLCSGDGWIEVAIPDVPGVRTVTEKPIGLLSVYFLDAREGLVPRNSTPSPPGSQTEDRRLTPGDRRRFSGLLRGLPKRESRGAVEWHPRRRRYRMLRRPDSGRPGTARRPGLELPGLRRQGRPGETVRIRNRGRGPTK